MRLVLQRVAEARVTVGGEVVGEIGRGLLVLVGAGKGDGEDDVAYCVDKTVNLRIFPDDGTPPQGPQKMNRSLLDVGGGLLAVSQFTLFGDTRKGRRPSFVEALEPVEAARLYERYVAAVRAAGVAQVATGRFAAHMDVALVNSGPVTILVDSKRDRDG